MWWQKARWRSNPQLLWSSSSGHWSREVPALPHCTSSPCPSCHMGPVGAGQELSKEQCGSGDAPALQALRPSPSLQCQHQEKPAAHPKCPGPGLAVRQGLPLRWPVAHWEQEGHREKITHFNKEMCSEREALRSCQHEHRQRKQSPGCLRPQLPPSPGSS